MGYELRASKYLELIDGSADQLSDDIIGSLPEDVAARWRETITSIKDSREKNPSILIYDLSVVHFCAVDFLDNHGPSRFVIGIAIRLWYWWWQKLLYPTPDWARSYNSDSSGTYNTAFLLHQIMRGHLTQDDKEYHILCRLASTICHDKPTAASRAARKLLQKCVKIINMEHAFSMDTMFLDEYVRARYWCTSHTMIFAKILPPEASILGFFGDILHVLQRLNHFLDRVSELDATLQLLLPRTQLLDSTMQAVGDAFMPLALEMQSLVLDKVAFRGALNLSSLFNSLAMMRDQLSRYPAPLELFRRDFKDFMFLFEKTIIELQFPVFRAMEAGTLKQRGLEIDVADRFQDLYRQLLVLRNEISVVHVISS